MPYLIVEYRHDPPVTDDQLYDGAQALEPCLKVRNVRKLRSYVSEDHTRGFCEFEPPTPRVCARRTHPRA